MSSTAPTQEATIIPQVEWNFHCASPIYSSPVAADLADDPGLEILVASSSERKLYCLSSHGQPLWTYAGFTLRVTSTPTVVDLDGDGRVEILVTTRSDGVVCLTSHGELIWKVPSTGGIPWGSATAADADKDGRMEVYWTTETGWVEAVAWDGSPLWSEQCPAVEAFASLALGDVNEVRGDEVIAAVGNGITCLDHQGNQMWRFAGLASFNTGAVICDLDGDGRPEILSASNDGVLYCLRGASGKPIWTHRTFAGRVDSTLAVGDVDGEGKREVLYGDSFGNLYCLEHDGTERWAYKAEDWIESAPVLGDIDGDSHVEVVFGSADGNVYCLSRAGELEWRFQTGRRIAASPTLCDIDDDGILEILVSSLSGDFFCLSAGGSWDASRVPWPMKRFNLPSTACSGAGKN